VFTLRAITPLTIGDFSIMTIVNFFFRSPSKKQIEENAAAGVPAPIQRKAVEVDVPYMDSAALSSVLASNDPKQVELLLEAANAVIYEQMRKQIDEQPNYQEVDLTKLDFAKVSWAAIANMPKAERISTAVSDETWEAFKADYVAVMVAATGKSKEVVSNAAKIIAAEFKPVRDNPAKLATLETYLDTWFTSTANGADFASLYERLSKKVKDFQQKGLASLEI
jgi:hypothetical protein